MGNENSKDTTEETGMKLMYFDDFRLGVLKGENVVDISDVVQDVPHIGAHDLINGVIERFADYRPRIETAVASRPGVPVAGVRVRPPLPKPFNIVCMAVNYMEDRTEPAAINSFLKSPNAIIGPEDEMMLPDVPATVFEGEAELALVIGKRASRVSESEAMGCIFGYINFVDGSARGLPPERNTYYQMKSRDTFAPIGPYIVTADEVKDPHDLRVRLWNNGVLMQDYTTSDMAHRIPRCISWVSAAHTLDPGDILSLGTSHGGLNPFMDGDVIEQEVDGLGRLRFSIRDDLKRTWAHESRDQRKKRGEKGVSPQLTGKYARV
jgi:2-keto-4-pentenoate hydratase/2-oxohepta-3-ene-1,7-dioic acid hydratase in catechol pathway